MSTFSALQEPLRINVAYDHTDAKLNKENQTKTEKRRTGFFPEPMISIVSQLNRIVE